MNTIKFDFNEDHKFNARVRIHGKDHLIDNPFLMKKLIEVCKRHGFVINRKGILKEEVEEIYHEYQKAVRHAIKVQIFRKIESNMKLVKVPRKVALASSMTAIAISTGVAALAYLPSTSVKGKEKEMVIEALEEELPQEEKSFITSKGITAVFEEEITPLELSVRNYPQQEDKIEEEKQEENLPTYEFHYFYEGEGESVKLENAKRYEDIMDTYASRYGLDKNLLLAIASQESGGKHNDYREGYSAVGLMQIERIHIGSSITGYNFEKEEEETITITLDALQNVETNIQIGALILQNAFERNHYNIPLALQEYNMGMGNMDTILRTCSEKENISIDSLKNNPEQNAWMKYRKFLNAGDSEYVEHVFQYLEGNILTFQTKEKGSLSYKIINDQKENNITFS